MSLLISPSASEELRQAKNDLPEEVYGVVDYESDPSDPFPSFFDDANHLDDNDGRIVGIYKLTEFRKVHTIPQRVSLREAK